MKYATPVILAACLFGCSLPHVKQEMFLPGWDPQVSGTSASLRGVCTVNQHVAWASGSNGTCLKTSDGGRTWKSCAVPGASSLDFRDVHAVDENRALLLSAGEPAKIFRTVDGGRNWTERYSNSTPGVFFDGMAFWDAERGIAFSDPVNGSFLLISTRDGGETWHPVPPEQLPAPIPGEAGFAASGTCIAVQGEQKVWFATGGTASRVFRSGSRGGTWSAFETPMASGLSSTGIFSIAFKDPRNGVIVGGDYEKPDLIEANAAWTDDAGKTWHLVEGAPPAGFRSCVAYVKHGPDDILITVGTSGSDYSLDNGRTWVRLGAEGYHSISFAGFHGFAVGAGGRIAAYPSR